MGQGNIIGRSNTPTLDTASGVFSIQEQYNSRRFISWPIFKYRYVRWTITAVRTPGNFVQASELTLLTPGGNFQLYGATATGPASIAGETPPNLIDFNFSTKFCSSSATGPWTINIDLSQLTAFTGYTWYTANDLVGRDPVSWTFETSVDNSTWVLRDSVSNFATTINRNAVAYTGNLS